MKTLILLFSLLFSGTVFAVDCGLLFEEKASLERELLEIIAGEANVEVKRDWNNTRAPEVNNNVRYSILHYTYFHINQEYKCKCEMAREQAQGTPYCWKYLNK